MAAIRVITDEDIRSYLRTNWTHYPSQIVLIQSAVQSLWQGRAPATEAERVVRLCLELNLQTGTPHGSSQAARGRSLISTDSM